MKPNQLKSLLKHIISEVQKNEMIANKDEQPDAFGFVNVEEGSRLFTSEANKAARAVFGNIVNISRISHPTSFGVWFAVTLPDGKKELIRKDRTGKWWYEKGRDAHGKLIMAEIPAEKMSEQTGTGAVAGYSTPFAFKATGGAGERRHKKKQNENNGQFEIVYIKNGKKVVVPLDAVDLETAKKAGNQWRVKNNIRNAIVRKKKLDVDEKTLPDGRYVDDMEDAIRMKRAEGLTEADTQHPPYLINIWWPTNVAGSGEGTMEELLKIAKEYGALEFAIWTNEDDPQSRKIVLWYDGRTDKPGKWTLRSKTNPELAKKRLQSLNEVSGTRYFAEVPEGAYFRIPGYDNLFQKISADYARNHGTGGMLKRPIDLATRAKKVKMQRDIMVNVMEGNVNEMTTSSAAGGQPGGMISVPAWGTKNREGSPRAIAASKSLGYKPVKSITGKEKKINESSNVETMYVFSQRPQIPKMFNPEMFENMPGFIEKRNYRTTQQWAKIVDDLASKYPPNTYLFIAWNDAAGTVTEEPLEGAIWSLKQFKQSKSLK